MGCANEKQSRQSCIRDINYNASPAKITKYIKKTVGLLEKYFKFVICSLKEKEKLEIHSPTDLIRYLRSCKSLTDEYVNEVEKEFLIYFNDLKQLMSDATSILSDAEKVKQLSKSKKNKIQQFIQLYENTCSQFFSYRQEFQYKVLLQGQIEKSQKRLSQHTLQLSNNNSVNTTSRTNLPKIY